jgi:hypothetical protein
MEPSPSTRFAWVHKRDGQLVPFDADKISRALFAAGESLGRPDAFMARELTDSVIHFLAAEAGGVIPTTTQIADLVIKVVRELAQPALARAFEEAQTRRRRDGVPVPAPPVPQPSTALRVGPLLTEVRSWVNEGALPVEVARRAGAASLTGYALQEVFARDLAAAHTAGLLTLNGLDAPLVLSGSLLTITPTTSAEVVRAVEDSRNIVGGFLAFDGPEFLLTRLGGTATEAGLFTQGLRLGLHLTGLRAVVNLNCTVPPARAEDLAAGPLFAAHRPTPEPRLREQLLETLLEHFLAPRVSDNPVRVDWHLGDRDFIPSALGTLHRLARRALEGAALSFVFDRPRRPVTLAEGVDRQHPAVLLTVNLDLHRLAEQAGPRLDPGTFLQKLGSLARLALSAATQKRDYLRRHGRSRPALAAGFLLDRARLQVTPVGLDLVVRTLVGHDLGEGGSAADLGRQIVHQLRTVLRDDGRACLMESCLDSPIMAEGHSAPLPEMRVAGLMGAASAASPIRQLQAASPLHSVAEAGTVTVFLTEEEPPRAEELIDLLRYAWHETDVVRMRFLRNGRPDRQQIAPWELSSSL